MSPLRNGLSVPTARLIRRGLPAVRIRRCRTADEPERAPGGLLSHRRWRLIAIREDSLMPGIQPHGGPRLTCPPGSSCGTSSCSAARCADARLRRHHGDPLARSAATSRYPRRRVDWPPRCLRRASTRTGSVPYAAATTSPVASRMSTSHGGIPVNGARTSATGLLIGVVGGLVSAAGTTGAGSAAAGAEALAALLIARIFVIPVTGAGE